MTSVGLFLTSLRQASPRKRQRLPPEPLSVHQQLWQEGWDGHTAATLATKTTTK